MRIPSLLSIILLFGTLGACDEEAPPPPPAETDAPAESAPAAAPPEPETAKKGADAPPPAWSNRLTKGSGFPCEVEKVLALTCRRCHWEPREHDAPFSLVKWDDTRGTRSGKPIFELMRAQVEGDLMPPVDEVVADPPVTALTPEQKKTLLEWLGKGAEKSDDVCEGT